MPASDQEFCERVCRTAKELGFTLDEMDTRAGWSFAFVAADGTRIAGTLQRERDTALVSACKKLLPHIYQHI